MISVRGLYCMFIKMTSAPPFCRRLHPFVQRGPEVVGLDPADGIDRTSLPYHQIGLLVDQQFGHALGQILGGLAVRTRVTTLTATRAAAA